MKKLYVVLIMVVFLIGCAKMEVSKDLNGKDDGNELLEQCSIALTMNNNPSITYEEVAWGAYCMGYIKGIVHINSGEQEHRQFTGNDELAFCIPEEVSKKQVTRVLVKYFQDHPESLHQRTKDLTFLALATAFPCNKESIGKKEKK